jgi:hypothetical protein
MTFAHWDSTPALDIHEHGTRRKRSGRCIEGDSGSPSAARPVAGPGMVAIVPAWRTRSARSPR